jgi:hypothetical protein
MVPAMALVVRRVIAEGGRVQGRMILQRRQEALAIITSFLSLSNGGLKGIVRSFIRSSLASALSSPPHRKVKRIQGLARCRFRLTLGRYSLLTILFERGMKILFAYVGSIIAGKVTKTIESSFLQRLKQRDDPSVIRSMTTLDFFAKFSDYLALNSAPNKIWRAARQDFLSGKFEIDLALRERLLLTLLLTLRRRHIISVMRTRVKKSNIPLVGEREVREFIQGGKDPLHDHMVRLDPVEFQHQDAMSSLLAHHSHHQQQRRNLFPPFLLFHTLTTGDMLEVCCEYLEKYSQQQKQQPRRERLTQLQHLQPSPSTTLAGISPVSAGGAGVGGKRRQQGTFFKVEVRDDESESSTSTRPAAPVILAPAPPLAAKPSAASGGRRFRKLLGQE